MLFHILVFCKSKYKLNACKKNPLKYEGLLLDPSNHKIISLIKKDKFALLQVFGKLVPLSKINL